MGDPEELSLPNYKAEKLRKKGKFQEAEEMLQELLASREESLGLEDPLTISAMNELAITYSQHGKHAEAAAMFRKVLTNVVKVHGVRKSLARELMLSSKRDIEEATTLLQDLLVDMENKFTADHAATIDCRETLAIALR